MTDSLAIVMVGEVDHGKSSLVGRLLNETGAISPSRIETVRRICDQQGKEFEYAFLLDAFEEEQRQGITIDVSHIQFATPSRNYHLIDAPGHREFLKNMLSGSSSADAAILLVDAHQGAQEQSRRHCYLLKLLGIKNVIVAVNKMDLVGYRESAFASARSEMERYLAELGIHGARYIPVSAKRGVNITKSNPQMEWYRGPSLLEALDGLSGRQVNSEGPIRFSVQDVYKFDEQRIIAGRMESGRLTVGDELKIWPSGHRVKVATIERWNAPSRLTAEAGESIGITLTEPTFVDRGNVLTRANESMSVSRFIDVSLFWMGREPLALHRPIKIKLLTQEYECQVTRIHKIIDTNSLQASSISDQQIQRHEAAEVTLKVSGPLLVDAFAQISNSGRFVLIDGFMTAGGGIVLKTNSEVMPLSQNIQRESSAITPAIRFERNGHRGAVVWLTGLSGSGKSTIAKLAEKKLFERGLQVFVLDGDNVRHGLSRDLDFSIDSRQENIRRVGEVAKLFAESGQIVIAALISPFEQGRQRLRAMMDPGLFFEVHVSCPIDICEQRDPKGLYKKARAGLVRNFTGVSSPFEEPLGADLVIDSSVQSPEDCMHQLMRFLEEKYVFESDQLQMVRSMLTPPSPI